MRKGLEKPRKFRIFRQYKNVNTIKNQKINMENLVNNIANTFTIILGTFTACAIGFTIYTVTIVM